jgi:hypothetical protein
LAVNILGINRDLLTAVILFLDWNIFSFILLRIFFRRKQAYQHLLGFTNKRLLKTNDIIDVDNINQAGPAFWLKTLLMLHILRY